jgi:alkylation response protein AidB-like acyl-CoA dehydrogenase
MYRASRVPGQSEVAVSQLFNDYRPCWETDQHRDLRKHAAEFFRKEATPNQERWVAQHAVDREFWTKAGAAGLLGLDLPEEFGGTNLLGDREGLGFYQLMEQLARERLIIATLCSALAEAAVLEAADYAKEREASGRPIGNFQHTKFVLAECKTEVLAIKTLVDYAIGWYVAGNNDPMTASMAKLFAAEKCDQVVDKCLQIFGGYGYMAEYPIANMYTASRVNRIYGGTSEIMKEIISRSL